MLKIIIFGAIPTYLLVKGSEWWLWVGYVVILLAYFHQRRTGSYVAAATNLVAAKLTFDALATEHQEEVDRVTKRVVTACGGSPDPTFRNEAQRYGWYALGMRELGVPPQILIPAWNIVKNPFNVPPRMWIDSAIDMAQKKHGVHVEIDPTTSPL